MLNLSRILLKYAKKFEEEILHNIKSGTDLKGTKYYPLADSTLKSQPGRNPNTRLNKTGNFASQGIQGKVNNNSIVLQANMGNAPGGIPYSKLLEYNDIALITNKTKATSKFPRIIPLIDSDIENMKSFKPFLIDLEGETVKQITNEIDKNINITTVIKVM